MQKDFHYYCIAVLAKAAGFNKKDALIIGYASQYVDDATESELIRLQVPRLIKFDPVRTAYAGLDLTGSLTWSAQKRVFIPFHFIPPRPFRPKESTTFSFVTQPAAGEQNGGEKSFAELLLEEAASESQRNRWRRLCRIGVALHTYADTWAHQRFSGRHNREENDVENIHVYDRDTGKYKRLKLENLILDALPQVGHAEAGYFPDLAFQKWKYDSRQSPPAVKRDNVELFLKAAEAIYDALVPLKKIRPDEPIPWETIAPDIRQLFEGEHIVAAETADRLMMRAYQRYHASDLGERCKKWQEKFDHLFRPYPAGHSYNYDHLKWRNEALKGDTAWDSWSQREWDQMRPMELVESEAEFWNSLWVHFHRAALRQRHLALENMP
ncbi:MAG: DUF6765 family protein [Chloroflexota bacterium]|nr:DUF6765 family protein [Chloroflexota bacterium]